MKCRIAFPVAAAAAFLVSGFTAPVASAAKRTAKDKKVDDAIVKALKYLAAQQDADGAWRHRSYGQSTATTSLAIMAFMAAGHVPGEGPYGDQLIKGIDWVLDQQVEYDRRKGHETVMLVARRSHGPMYSHGIATLMLAEVVGMLKKDRARRAREALEKSIRLIVQSQNVRKSSRHEGGWRYQASSRDSDISVTGWQLLALRAAKNVGCDVPKDNIDRAVEYVKNCKSRFGGFGYQPYGGPTATRTGTGILCLEICGKHKTAEAMAGADYLLRRPLRSSDHYFFYGVYYCTVGMFKVGGKYWDATKANTHRILIPSQNVDGSWSGSRGEGRRHGRVYTTSLSVLALAVEYRFLPIYQR